MSPSSEPPAHGGPATPDGDTDASPTGHAAIRPGSLDGLTTAVAVVDDTGRVVALNDAWQADVRPGGVDDDPLTYEALCGRQVPPPHARRLAAIVERVLAGETDHVDEDVDVSTVAAPLWLHVEAVAHVGPDGRRAALVTHGDITRHRQDAAHLAWLADHDQLTGLANRRRLVRELGEHIAACGPERPVGVVFVDVAGFSRVEDSLGQVLGDQLVHEVGLRLATTLGDRGLAAAVGGDQFALVVPATSRGELEELTTRVAEGLSQPFRSHGVSGLVTGTQGVALVTDPTQSASEALRDADTAMLHVRSSTGTLSTERVAFFDESIRARLLERVDLESGLRQAVRRDELHLVFQPIVELATGRVVSAEALLRWIRPRRGLVTPDRFVPVAEETGLMGEIGSWVMRSAVAHAARWSADGHPVPVAVNVSVQQLVPGFVDEVREALDEHALPASRLVIEVTESAVMADPDAAMSVLRALRRLGCRIAMDDFGTGHSSLINLKRLPIQVVKLDKAFVAGVADEHSADGSIVAALLGLTEALGLVVVVEGVETTEQVTRLQQLGCTFGQGFLYSAPRDPHAMAAYLDEAAELHGVHPTIAMPEGPQPSRTVRSADESASPVSGLGTKTVSASSGSVSGGV